jgi:hypothetical protein
LGIAFSTENSALAALVVDEGQFDRPIVRQVDHAPATVIIGGLGNLEIAGLGEVGLSRAIAEILGGIARMAECKTPAKVEQGLFARRYPRVRALLGCGRGDGRSHAGGWQQRGCRHHQTVSYNFSTRAIMHQNFSAPVALRPLRRSRR